MGVGSCTVIAVATFRGNSLDAQLRPNGSYFDGFTRLSSWPCGQLGASPEAVQAQGRDHEPMTAINVT